MADWSLYGDGQTAESGGFVPATTLGTTVTSHASANTKGSYVELITATAWAGSYLYVSTVGAPTTTGTLRDFLIDIAMGSAGSETVIVPNLVFTQNPSTTPFSGFFVLCPLETPKGSRISARCQDSTGGGDVKLVVHVLGGGSMGPTCQLCTSVGADTTDSGGQVIDPGASTNTEGAIQEMSAAVPFDVRAVAMTVGLRRNTSQAASGYWAFDLLVGAGGSEVVAIPDICVNCNASEFLVPSAQGAFPCHIKKGSRVSLRVRSNLNDATDRLLDVVLHLFS